MPDFPVAPLPWLPVVPLVVLCLYVLFRWRRFGEDDYTWNHQYFQLAFGFGLALCVTAWLSHFLPEPWQHAVLWTAVFVAAALTLRFARHQDWGNTSLLATSFVAVGLLSIPVAGAVGRAMLRPTRWTPPPSPLARIPRSTFAPEFPAPWREQPGSGSPRTYTRGEPGSGLLMVSLYPPSDAPHSGGADAEADLTAALDSIARGLGLGPRLALGHVDAAAGPLAYADYRSDTHGPLRFWMLLAEVRVFASYTDGQSPAAEREIAEAQTILQAARFEHHPAAR